MNGKRKVDKPTRWTKKLVALLGTAPGAAIGRWLRISAGAVKAARRSRAIPAFQPSRPPVDWTAEKIALLGRRRMQQSPRNWVSAAPRSRRRGPGWALDLTGGVDGRSDIRPRIHGQGRLFRSLGRCRMGN